MSDTVERPDDPPAAASAEQPSLRRRPPRTTIHDVARAAGCSIGTVSKALSGRGTLRAETRARIVAVAEGLGFQPNDLAQSLHRGQTFTAGLISNDNFGRFSIPIMEGLEERLADSRISVFMCNAADDAEREALHIRALLKKRVDGIVVTARRIDMRPRIEVGSADVAIVYAFSQADDPDAHCILPDDEGGAVLATEHLAALGRRRIAHVTGPERFQAVRHRRDGYRKTLQRLGLEAPERHCLPGVWSEAWGREGVARLFAGAGAPPDAIFCGSDQIARGAADALRERGVRVPEDVALVGFDNWEVIAAATRPALTTIDMNLKQLGRETGRRLIEMIAGAALRGIVRIPCTLVVRDSCGAKTGGGEAKAEQAR
jgi:LacI family transcriptional regulator